LITKKSHSKRQDQDQNSKNIVLLCCKTLSANVVKWCLNNIPWFCSGN